MGGGERAPQNRYWACTRTITIVDRAAACRARAGPVILLAPNHRRHQGLHAVVLHRRLQHIHNHLIFHHAIRNKRFRDVQRQPAPHHRQSGTNPLPPKQLAHSENNGAVESAAHALHGLLDAAAANPHNKHKVCRNVAVLQRQHIHPSYSPLSALPLRLAPRCLAPPSPSGKIGNSCPR